MSALVIPLSRIIDTPIATALAIDCFSHLVLSLYRLPRLYSLPKRPPRTPVTPPPIGTLPVAPTLYGRKRRKIMRKLVVLSVIDTHLPSKPRSTMFIKAWSVAMTNSPIPLDLVRFLKILGSLYLAETTPIRTAV